MDTLTIMKTATTLLAITALGGLTMAGIRFVQNKNPPNWLAMLHGLLAAAAVILLAYAVFTVGLPGLAKGALTLFVLAAAGGVLLNLGYQMKNLPLPKGLVIGHATLAIVGFALLLAATLQSS
jgi:hypothetical protein